MNERRILTPEDLAEERVQELRRQGMGDCRGDLDEVATEDMIPVLVEQVDRGQFGGGHNNGPRSLTLAIGVALGLITTPSLVALMHADIWSVVLQPWQARGAPATNAPSMPCPELDPAAQPGAHWRR